MKYQYYVYILSSKNGTLYTGETNDLVRRTYQHKNKSTKGFTNKYEVFRLVYFEETDDVHIAIEREKVIKGWVRKKKLDLIKETNPEFKDLSIEWFESN